VCKSATRVYKWEAENNENEMQKLNTLDDENDDCEGKNGGFFFHSAIFVKKRVKLIFSRYHGKPDGSHHDITGAYKSHRIR